MVVKIDAQLADVDETVTSKNCCMADIDGIVEP